MADLAAPFTTDAGVLAVFDPKLVQHRMRQPSTWWREAAVLDLPELLDGKLAVFPLGHEGSFAVRVTLEAAALPPEEQPLSVGSVAGLGVAVTSEDLFAGAAERLPGDGVGDRVVEIPGTGKFWKVPPGEYDVTVHVLDWRRRKEFFDEEGEPLPHAPADFVVQLQPRARAFDAPNELRALLDLLPRAEVPKERLRVPPSPPRREPSFEPRRAHVSRSPSAPPPPVVEEPPAPPAFGPFDPGLVRRAFRDVVRAQRGFQDPQPGLQSLIVRPRDTSLQAKEIEVEDLLTKMTRVRDQMRVLEQKVNSHETLEDEAKLALDAHVTRVYESIARLLSLLS